MTSWEPNSRLQSFPHTFVYLSLFFSLSPPRLHPKLPFAVLGDLLCIVLLLLSVQLCSSAGEIMSPYLCSICSAKLTTRTTFPFVCSAYFQHYKVPERVTGAYSPNAATPILPILGSSTECAGLGGRRCRVHFTQREETQFCMMLEDNAKRPLLWGVFIEQAFNAMARNPIEKQVPFGLSGILWAAAGFI